MINGLFDSGALMASERMVQFTGERQKLIAHNIANIDTPYYQQLDLDPTNFQAQLGEALDRKRQAPNPRRAPLELRSTRQATVRDGRIEFHPRPSNENILFHDQNNRSLEHIMQDLVENNLVHRAAVDLLKNQFDMLELAIRERI